MKLRFGDVLTIVVLLTGAACPVEGWGQTRTARVGILTIQPPASHRQWYGQFFRGLRDQGWIEGKNLEFVYASSFGDPSRYGMGAAELVGRKVDVIYADSAPAIRASRAATRTIPIVGEDYTTDPVAEGYAESYSRPGGNITGVFLGAPEFSGKWLELLRAIVPGLSRAVVFWDPSPGDAHLRALQAAARPAGIQLQIVEIREPQDIDSAASAFRGRPQALVVLPSPMTGVESARLAGVAKTLGLPATSIFPEFAANGGLVAYGPDGNSADERCGILVAKILSGAKPAELPIERPRKFDLVVNLKAAKALGLTIPESVLARADEVIR